ncbi:MAG: GTP-binding protein [Gammaproteobacteria bacterium]|nr:GTP-binding protein [Gammaproteobacteria bacterium]
MKEKPVRIPTNIITGFLGVGKTTVIQHLLACKPSDERWAVLVNEFGEVGIDGNLFSSADNERDVTISQVPGGCMCCTNGLPMQMALNLLLAKAKPHRLLIEPTGLGHPREVLAVLAGKYYRDVLNLQTTLSLVDARKIQDSRYTSNSTYNQQIEIAQVVIASKSDLYGPNDFAALKEFIDAKFGLETKQLYKVQHGAVEPQWLDHVAGEAVQMTLLQQSEHDHHSPLVPIIESPDEGFVTADNEGEGYYSRGWIFNPGWQFCRNALFDLFQGIESERMKGVFITPNGGIGLNKADNVVTELSLESGADSRVEVIASDPGEFDSIEKTLLGCVKERME